MSRNMIGANRAVFELLESHCARFEDPIASAGSVRFVQGDPSDEGWLKDLKFRTIMTFSQSRSLASLQYQSEEYITTLGFDFPVDLPGLVEDVPNAGLAVCLWSEVKPRPASGAARIRDIVEVAKSGDPGYQGHDWVDLATLFPSLWLGRLVGLADDETIWRLFFRICVDESRQSNSWMEEALSQELLSLADLDVPVLPYRALCRSVFDADPRGLFMALYRCVEATYAYETCKRLVKAWSLPLKWHEVAADLDAEVGWRPREATSLQLVLRYALPQDLRELCTVLGSEHGDDPVKSASRALYDLRNHVVHYRPVAELLDQERLDWNRICYLLVGIVLHVFSHAYAPPDD